MLGHPEPQVTLARLELPTARVLDRRQVRGVQRVFDATNQQEILDILVVDRLGQILEIRDVTMGLCNLADALEFQLNAECSFLELWC